MLIVKQDVDVSMRITKGAGLIRCGCVDEDNQRCGAY